MHIQEYFSCRKQKKTNIIYHIPLKFLPKLQLKQSSEKRLHKIHFILLFSIAKINNPFRIVQQQVFQINLSVQIIIRNIIYKQLIMSHLTYQLSNYNNFIEPILLYPNPFLQYAYPPNYFVPFNYSPYYNCITGISQQKSIEEDEQKNSSRMSKSDDEDEKTKIKEGNVFYEGKVQKVDRTFSKQKSQKNCGSKSYRKAQQLRKQKGKDVEITFSFDNDQKKLNSKSKKIYKQNPCRNIVTNIGNQMITYICTLKKSQNRLIKIVPGINESDIKLFYQYAWNLKKQHDYYLNFQKIKDFWFKEDTEDDRKFKKIIRILSNYFLRWVLPFSILTSKKMSQCSREFHLKSRKQLLKRLKMKN